MRMIRRPLPDTPQRLPRRKPVPFAQSAKGQWLFRSFDDLLWDLQDWSARLPALVAVCGVPRSGAIVASMLSTMLNIPLISLDSLQSEQSGWRPSVSKPLPRLESGSILVVDDTVWSGGTLLEVKKSLSLGIQDRCVFGAVYVNAKNLERVDVYGFAIESLQHCFAWNYLRDIHARRALTDMDGVLCDEWTGPAAHATTPEYLAFLETCRPRVRPIYPVLGIVTGRAGEHRTQTEKWLGLNGVQYTKLVMPFATCEQRKGQCIGTAKAAVYQDHSEATLFIESDAAQAQIIHRLTGRPVLCTDTLEMIQ